MSALATHLSMRRTFAIIAHPDAGKTTLTEKLLLFAGAIQVAGAVKSHKVKRYATSDFLEIERQRGISVATSVMSFEYKGMRINLLDTPGHKDFAEDTYRTLSAVDSAILVIDSVKGVEEQTHKLMEVCRMRAIPVMVFVNKMDRDGKNPYDLLSEIEQKLSLPTHPITFPIGSGREFKGVAHIMEDTLLLFQAHGTPDEAAAKISHLSEEWLVRHLGAQNAAQLKEDSMLISGTMGQFDRELYLRGEIAPVFFGSAVNNFGVKELLEAFIKWAPAPQPRATTQGLVQPEDKHFSGFVFKIHANIDPRHRDRIAFFRVCSGVFKRHTFYHHTRLDKRVRFASPYVFLAREKNVLEDAYAGDVIGLFDTGMFKIGDTLTEGVSFYFTGIPNFSPELFKAVINTDPVRTKQLEKGLMHLADEGIAQLFTLHSSGQKIIGCVGALQFEVIQYRLVQEYGAACQFQPLPFYRACWLGEKTPGAIDNFIRFKTPNIARDKEGTFVYLAESEWFLQTEINNNPDIIFRFSNEMLS